MVQVVGLVVADLHDDPLASHGIVLGDERLRRLGVGHPAAHQPGEEVTDALVDVRVGERPQVRERADADGLRRSAAPRRAGETRDADGRGPLQAPQLPVVLLDVGLELGIGRCDVGREGVVGRPLEDREGPCDLGDLGDRLDPRRAGADDAHPLALEIDALAGPEPGVHDRPGEGVEPRYVGEVRRRQRAGGHDDPGGRVAVPVIGLDHPAPSRLVERRPGNAGAEHEVASQVVALGDVVDVPLDLRLGGHRLRERPLLLEVLVEAVRVLDRRHVAPAPGVAVPVPRPADAVGCLDPSQAQAELPEPVGRVEPGDAGADDDHVEVELLGIAAPALEPGRDHGHLRSPPLVPI